MIVFAIVKALEPTITFNSFWAKDEQRKTSVNQILIKRVKM